MLKKRIIPIQLLLNGRLVKTVRFQGGRDVGDPVKSSSVYNAQSADELVFLNISREPRSFESLTGLMKEVSKACFMPVSMGGGIHTVEDAATLILNGADKVVMNSVTYRTRETITETAERFGNQAVIVGIDAAWDESAQAYTLFSECGRRKQEVSLEEHVSKCEAAGAGEILIQSIDRDGTMSGYDIRLIKSVMAATSLPVIGAGGAGNYAHLKDAFLETEVTALACGSLFNFSDSNPLRAKAYLSNYGLSFKKI